MELNRFKQCAGAYGAARRRWPQREQALHDRLAGTPEGAAILAEAERSDRFLDGYAPAAPRAGYASAAPQARVARRIGALATPAWRRYGALAAAFAASAVLGFAVGFAQVRSAGDAEDVARLLLGPQSVQEIEL